MSESGRQDSTETDIPARIASPCNNVVDYCLNDPRLIHKSELPDSGTRFRPWSRACLAGPMVLALIVFLTGPGGPAFGQSQAYPQIGSVWWGSGIYKANPSQAAKIPLYLAPNFTTTQANAVRASNPGSKILDTVNAMETTGGVPVVPDSYYLLDVNGKKIQNWPGTPGNFLLNLTNPDVVTFMATYAASQLTQSGFTYDGMFFDNVELADFVR